MLGVGEVRRRQAIIMVVVEKNNVTVAFLCVHRCHFNSHCTAVRFLCAFCALLAVIFRVIFHIYRRGAILMIPSMQYLSVCSRERYYQVS
jgi:hypothetical protein